MSPAVVGTVITVYLSFPPGNTLEARLRGARFACANLANVLEPGSTLSSLLSSQAPPPPPDNNQTCTPPPPPLLLVYCARGGQRSMGLATILAEVGWLGGVACLAGGFKAWRRLLLRQLEAWPLHRQAGGMAGRLWVLASLTGTLYITVHNCFIFYASFRLAGAL